MLDVSRWLSDHGLEHHAETFKHHGIGGDILHDLTDADLRELGLNLGDRKRLLKVLQSSRDQPLEAGESMATPALPHSDRRQITVLFADLVDSTAIGARLDPEEMTCLIRAYQDASGKVIRHFDGFVAKYVGDGIVAYFGFPKAHEIDAERAIRAGCDLVRAVAALSAPDATRLAARVGIATGLTVVSEIGDGSAREHAVIGDAPNLAARLQGLARPSEVVIAAETARLVGSRFELEDLGYGDLKGFSTPIRSFRVVGEGELDNRFSARAGTNVTPLVGRTHELGLLMERWERAREGEGQVVLLAGEAGIGKSRLVRALQERVAAKPHALLTYDGSPFHINSELYPVIRSLERAAGFGPSDPADTRLTKLRALLGQSAEWQTMNLSPIADLLGVSEQSATGPSNAFADHSKWSTLDAIVRYVTDLARTQPLLAIYEDAHWFDPTTLEAIGLILERTEQRSMMVLLTHRPDFAPPWSGTNVMQLPLTRLGRRDGAAMALRVTAGKPLPDEVLAAIVKRTDGVPLFVEELTKAILESGLLQEADGGWVLNGPLPPISIPASLQDSLMARLDRLPLRAKEVAQVAAVIGREFDQALLATVMQVPREDLQGALDQLVAAELIFGRDHLSASGYGFKHAMVCEAAYHSLLHSRRRDIHARLLAALEESAVDGLATQPEVLAHHATEAGLRHAAGIYWLQAGKRAAKRSAHREAVAHLTDGLTAIGGSSGSSEDALEIELRMALATSLPAMKGFAAPEVGEAYARAEQLCQQTGEATQLYTVLQGFYFYRTARAELRLGRELADQCYALAQREGNPVMLLGAQNALFHLLHAGGDFAGASRILNDALAADDQAIGGPTLPIAADLRVFVRSFGSHTAWHIGNVDAARELSAEAIHLAKSKDDRFSIGLALDYAATLAQLWNDRQAAATLAAEAVQLCSENHFSYYLAWALIIEGWAVALSGEAEGARQISRGLAALEAKGARVRRPYYLGLLAEAHGVHGQMDEACRTITEALATASATGERWYDAELHRLQGELYLMQKPRVAADRADACFSEALAIARRQGAKGPELHAAMSLARLWAEQNCRRRALSLLGPVCGWFDGNVTTPDVIEARELLDELRESASC